VLFPIIFASTTFGVCMMMDSLAAFCSIFIIYDFETKWPWWIFIGCCLLGMLCAALLKDKN
jgi:hypothetical protein